MRWPPATATRITGHIHRWSDQQYLPLRVTLAWTDPPGNPAAAIKLVNSLELVVTNLDDPANPIVYYGNDIPVGQHLQHAGNGNQRAEF